MFDQLPTWVVDVVNSEPFAASWRIAFLILLAIIVRAIVLRMISGALRRAATAQSRLGAVGNAERREQRVRALSSMLRSLVSALIALVCTAMILSVLGFNITGVLTGTTIVAATVAFGMQNVIKDLVAGVTLLLEDQLGVGDYVDLGPATGTVERVGLRTTTVRDDDGNLWYVRNGEVDRVGNFSQGGSGRPITFPVQRVRLVDESAEG